MQNIRRQVPSFVAESTEMGTVMSPNVIIFDKLEIKLYVKITIQN